VDLAMVRWREGYAERDLYRSSGRYGALNLAAVISWVVAVVVGLGLVTSTASIFSWVGYLLPLFGGDSGALAGSSLGLVIAFALAGILYAVLSAAIPPERRVIRTRAPIELGAKVG